MRLRTVRLILGLSRCGRVLLVMILVRLVLVVDRRSRLISRVRSLRVRVRLMWIVSRCRWNLFFVLDRHVFCMYGLKVTLLLMRGRVG